MSSNSPINSDNQEIDLAQIANKVNGIYDSLLNKLFRFILFVKKNIILFIVLFIVGAGIGFYLDKKVKSYDHQVIVSPNFGSIDYLYAQINLVQSKVNEGDTVFLKKIGIKNAKKFGKIEIKPIVDVYKFIENNKENFDLIKLLAEDGNIEKVVENELTSKNYPFHLITFKTSKVTSEEETVLPILNFLNESDYFKQMKKEYLNNIQIKMQANDTTISQIDGLLNQFKNRMNSNHSDKLIYFNENTQLNEVIITKDNLLKEQSHFRLTLIRYEKVIKEISVILNNKNTKGTNGKMKFIVPFIFITLFLLISTMINFYKKQTSKIELIDN
ncbi:hypothetical protein M0M57_06680 [Flavobacterium azooxidireducens]|uniref:Polysaccharide chain length determinant N-terminal domain-containing protein n=1 Tax=Flavobacterium azooxidireducens TaxID=1871076 RepID=A0ABY4KIZ5_9FLAO|nr:hypothetical protein [Flavobacterium azooxidireducens]UPQ80519.1 hypothetical protein M0M57_06680 [Flavobacterium azooxidireducens]